MPLEVLASVAFGAVLVAAIAAVVFWSDVLPDPAERCPVSVPVRARRRQHRHRGRRRGTWTREHTNGRKL